MEASSDKSPPLVSQASYNPLLRVCSLLNEAGARYLVIGGYACILYGLARTTKDVDILVQNSEANFVKIIEALSKLEDAAAAELSPQDFIDNLVVKVADEVEVDISRQAWTVTYDEAAPLAITTLVQNISIPVIGLTDLIKSKTTYREQDLVDVTFLRRLAAVPGRLG